MTETMFIEECAFAKVVSIRGESAILIAGSVIRIEAPLDIAHFAAEGIVKALRRNNSDETKDAPTAK